MTEFTKQKIWKKFEKLTSLIFTLIALLLFLLIFKFVLWAYLKNVLSYNTYLIKVLSSDFYWLFAGILSISGFFCGKFWQGIQLSWTMKNFIHRIDNMYDAEYVLSVTQKLIKEKRWDK